MGAKYVQLATEGYAGRAAASAVSTHAADTTAHVTAAEKSTWNAKSTVGVSTTGTATDTVEYITIDGVEKKLAGGGGTGDYTDLTNKPQIGGVELNGNKTLAQIGAASATDLAAEVTRATAAEATAVKHSEFASINPDTVTIYELALILRGDN